LKYKFRIPEARTLNFRQKVLPGEFCFNGIPIERITGFRSLTIVLVYLRIPFERPGYSNESKKMVL
jgi:hypothetical protein